MIFVNKGHQQWTARNVKLLNPELVCTVNSRAHCLGMKITGLYLTKPSRIPDMDFFSLWEASGAEIVLWYIAFSKTLLFPPSPGLCSCNDSCANSFAEHIVWFVMLPAVPLQRLLFLHKVCTEHFHNYNIPKAESNGRCIHYTRDVLVLPFGTLKTGSFKVFITEGKNTYYHLGAQFPLAFSGDQVLRADDC